MLVREIMINKVPIVDPAYSADDVAKKMLEMEVSYVFVVKGGSLAGVISGFDLHRLVAAGRLDITAEQMMTPRSKLIVVRPNTPLEEVVSILTEKNIMQLPVLDGGEIVGCIDMRTAMKHTSDQAKKLENLVDTFQQAALLIDSMSEGVVVVDRSFCIREFNAAAEKFTGCSAEAVIGRPSSLYRDKDNTVRQVMVSGEAIYGAEVQTNDGKIFLTNNVPIIIDGSVEGVLQTFSDITAIKQVQHQLMKTRDELDRAFSMTLPNCQMEYKMKNTCEYRDIYNAKTGMIEITEVIKEGGYQHVINALKVVADLNDKGIMEVLGIDRCTLVQALIFHDIGKSQPVLNIGQVVDPRRVFEESKEHARRSADIVKTYCEKPEDVTTLIKYHHHSEDELPNDFPDHLLPMLRLMKIIDGLSAGLTRRYSRVGFRVSGSRLMVLEHNTHPTFNRTVEVDLYTGNELVYSEKKVQPIRQEAFPN